MALNIMQRIETEIYDGEYLSVQTLDCMTVLVFQCHKFSNLKQHSLTISVSMGQISWVLSLGLTRLQSRCRPSCLLSGAWGPPPSSLEGWQNQFPQSSVTGRPASYQLSALSSPRSQRWLPSVPRGSLHRQLTARPVRASLGPVCQEKTLRNIM